MEEIISYAFMNIDDLWVIHDTESDAENDPSFIEVKARNKEKFIPTIIWKINPKEKLEFIEINKARILEKDE